MSILINSITLIETLKAFIILIPMSVKKKEPSLYFAATGGRAGSGSYGVNWNA